ncbi:MAG: radical SAM protein [Polyangiales bacterium]
MSGAKSRRLDVMKESFHPAYVVWELTLRCDHACKHCGSRANEARPDELPTEEALDVCQQLADAGAREVVLIGGEAYLHDGFYAIARRLRALGVRVGVTSGGLGIDEERAQAMAEAGVMQCSISVDGVAGSHDRIRAKSGSHRSALSALHHLKSAGIRTASNINLNRVNVADLEALYPLLRDAGVTAWQVQLTAALGRAADRPQMLLQPYELIALMPRIANLKRRAHEDGMLLMLGNNLGYFGPDEATLRSLKPGAEDHWQGCQAGRFVMGVESDGGVKGCPSLQSAHYIGGHLRKRSLKDIWDDAPQLAFARARTREDLWGYCAECAYGDTCLGGCSFTAHALFGKPGNNPYCVHRARMFNKRGLKERLVAGEAAKGLPFDNGRFVIEEVAFDAPEDTLALDGLVRIGRKPARTH